MIEVPTIAKRCKRCAHGDITRVRQKKNDGGYHVIDLCNKCKENATPGYFIPQKGMDVLLLPEYIPPYLDQHKCAHTECGSFDTQYHHFAPKHLFDDYENWPGAWLCKMHHREWHNVVTPNMVKIGKAKTHEQSI